MASTGPASGPERAPADDMPPASARLLIHVADRPEPSALRQTWQRLARSLSGRGRGRHGLPLKVAVQDLEGHRIGSIEPAGPLTQLQLPAGTYVVMASSGSERRTYTLTLSAGTSFELNIELPHAGCLLPSTSS